MTTTLATIYQEVENEVGGLITGTATSLGTTLTIVDSALGDYDDDSSRGPNGLSWALIKSGTADGDVRKISSFAQSTGTVTVNRVFTAAIASAVTYELHRFKPSKILEKFNLAISNTKYVFQTLIDEDSVGVANTYEYDVPDEITGEPLQIWWELLDQGSDPIKPYEQIFNWTYDKAAHSVIFDFVIPTDRIIRFVGLGRLTALTTEASTTEVDQPEIRQLYAMALFYLFQEEYYRSVGQARKYWKEPMDEWEYRAEELGMNTMWHYPERTRKIPGWTIGNSCGVSSRNNAGWQCGC